MAPSWGVIALFVVPALALLVIFRALPVVISIVGSFFRQNLVGEMSFHGLGNYETIFADEGFWHSVLTTLKFNLILNPILVCVAFGLALLTFAPTRGIGLFRSALFVPMTFSTSLAAVLWTLILDPNLGPANPILSALGIGRQPFFLSESQALPTMMAIVVWKSAGYWMIFLLAGLYRIPGDIYEAAEIDGANWLQRLRYITIPQMRRPLAFVLVATTSVNFLFFAPIYIITKGGPNGATDMLMFRTYESAFVFINWGRALALSTVLLLIICVFAAIQLRLLGSKEGED
jgi:multiple sugar transport system permease protein